MKKAKLATPMTNMMGRVDQQNSIVISLGACEHNTHPGGWLKPNKEHKDYSSVTIPNGELVDVKSVGNISLSNNFELK